MQYEWIDISQKTPDESNHAYLVCLETGHHDVFEWRLAIAHWYDVDDTVDIYESDGTKHHFVIKKRGFYQVNECNPKDGHVLYLIHGVKYWTDIQLPENNPEDTLTIE